MALEGINKRLSGPTYHVGWKMSKKRRVYRDREREKEKKWERKGGK